MKPLQLSSRAGPNHWPITRYHRPSRIEIAESRRGCKEHCLSGWSGHPKGISLIGVTMEELGHFCDINNILFQIKLRGSRGLYTYMHLHMHTCNYMCISMFKCIHN